MKFYLCNQCDKLVVDFEDTDSKFTHCDEEMMELVAKSDFDKYHKPIMKQNSCLVTISVGEEAHEMIDIHHISFIAIETNQGNYFRYLKKYQKPETSFIIDEDEVVKKIYVYCNIHLLYCLDLENENNSK